ncbi:MAG TPA: hypothetical protein VFL36_06065 [Myxococcales bacterium]|nr:hypothetical protein [Myxococcales bacterium]
MKTVRAGWFLAALSVTAACSSYGSGATAQKPPQANANVLQSTIGPEGGVLSGAAGTALEGVKLVIPPNALAAATMIQIQPVASAVPLPASALRVGPQLEIAPAGTQLAIPAQVTVPFDDGAVSANDRFGDEVEALVLSQGQWAQTRQSDSAAGSLTFNLSRLDVVSAGIESAGSSDRVQFDLHINPRFATCLAQFPGDNTRLPSATATLVRGELNDSLELRGRNIKPGLKFDLFTVERSTLKSDGTPDATIPNVGFAWYQSELEANDDGRVRAAIRTILLDEIFGVDQAVPLAPVNTFHLGFWFDDPQDAAACGFNPLAPTPFNGKHHAGPLAMITVPDATTALGPLCTHPDTSTVPARCGL